MVGAMADLVPPQQIAELTGCSARPTSTASAPPRPACRRRRRRCSRRAWCPPACPSVSSLCSVRLVDADDREVPTGTPGELAMRARRRCSRATGTTRDQRARLPRRLVPHGRRVRAPRRRHAGLRRPREVPDQVGRREHLPGRDRTRAAGHPAVADAAVVRQRDANWGEVPVAFVALQATAPCDADTLLRWCRAQLASLQAAEGDPRRRAGGLPRSSTGKIQRHEIERLGMIPFAKPGASEPYHVMGEKATRLALADAGVDYKAIQQAFVGYVYGDSTCGQRALYPVGMTGIPVLNVNNNCSTGSSALFLARQAVQSGAADCVLALGFEQMQPGAIKAAFTDRPTPFRRIRPGHRRARRPPRDPARAALLRRRRQGPHGQVRHQAGNLRSHPRQGQPPCRQQPAGAVPQGSQHRGRDGLADALGRRDDAPDGLPADLRRRRRGGLL
jgi:hypothetical protein